jgi:adenylylsulfate reductase subunit A
VLARRGVIIATGGASGIYRTANTGAIAHRMWYSPFNTGAGYAMGIRAGAEMTGFEMRFIPTRLKDSATPTGVLAQTFKVPQVNILGEQYLRKRYGFGTTRKATTCERLYYMLKEIKEGRGPVCFKTGHFTAEQIHELTMSLLDMSPAFVLQWAANNIDLSRGGMEIATSGPYITGGHAQSGYWIDRHRRTTVPGLYAAGDVAGGAPKKYVSGCWVEGFIAAQACLADHAAPVDHAVGDPEIEHEAEKTYAPLNRFKEKKDGVFPHEIETKLQKIMDEYAGGIHTFYEIHQRRLDIARRMLGELKCDAAHLLARDFHELNLCHEVLERIDVAEVVLAHLEARKETRWPAYQTRIDYPERDDTNWLCFLNSVRDPGSGDIRVFTRPYHPAKLVQGL